MKKIIREVPPNVTAQKYLLDNRDPEHWLDRQEVHQTGTTTTVIVQESDVQLL